VRKVPAFGRDEDLVAAGETAIEGVRESPSDRALASLAAVVDGRVEDVDAGSESRVNAPDVPVVRRCVFGPEIRPQPDRRQTQSGGLPKVPRRGVGALGETLRPLRRGPTGNHGTRLPDGAHTTGSGTPRVRVVP